MAKAKMAAPRKGTKHLGGSCDSIARGHPCSFKASVAEILEWQSSFRAYYAT